MLVANQDQTPKEDAELSKFFWPKEQCKDRKKKRTNTGKSDYSSKARPRTDYCAFLHAEGKQVPVVAHYPAPETYYTQYQHYDLYVLRNPLPTLPRNKEQCVTFIASD